MRQKGRNAFAGRKAARPDLPAQEPASPPSQEDDPGSKGKPPSGVVQPEGVVIGVDLARGPDRAAVVIVPAEKPPSQMRAPPIAASSSPIPPVEGKIVVCSYESKTDGGVRVTKFADGTKKVEKLPRKS